MRRGFLPAAAIAACSMLGACATVTRGTRTGFTIASEPPGATAVTSTGYSCVSTPCRLNLPRRKSFDVIVSKPGYHSRTLHVASKLGGGGVAGFLGNAMIGGAIGAAIDASSGAMDDLVPNHLDVRLQPQQSFASAVPPPVAQAPLPPPEPPPLYARAEVRDQPEDAGPPPPPAQPARAYADERHYAQSEAPRGEAIEQAPQYAPPPPAHARPMDGYGEAGPAYVRYAPPPQACPRRPDRPAARYGDTAYARPAYDEPAGDASDFDDSALLDDSQVIQ